MARTYAKYPLEQIMKITEEFYKKECYDLVKKYSEEFSSRYPTKWKSTLLDNNIGSKTLFETIEDVLSEKLNLPICLNNHFESIHGLNLFHNKTNHFGIECLRSHPDEFNRKYNSFPFPNYSIFDFYPTTVSPYLYDLLDISQFKYHLELTIKYNLKKHYLRGHISNFWLSVDLLCKYGYDALFKYYDLPKQYYSVEQRSFQNRKLEYESSLNIIKSYRKINPPEGIYTSSQYDSIFILNLHGDIANSSNNMPYDFSSLLSYFEIEPFDIIKDKADLDEYLLCEKGVENDLRAIFNLPKYGEGWISETKLFHQIKTHFNEHLVIQHAKTKWLGRQHLDIYFPFLNIAIEYQGKQHYEPIDFFGGLESFTKALERDKKKKDLCLKNKCKLIEVKEGYNIQNIIEEITYCIK